MPRKKYAHVSPTSYNPATGGLYKDPSPEEIEKRAADVRASWDRETTSKRSRWATSEVVEIPELGNFMGYTTPRQQRRMKE